MRARSSQVLLGVFLPLFGSGCLASLPQPSTAPTFLWSPHSYFTSSLDHQTARVSYEVVLAQVVADEFIGALAGSHGVGQAAGYLLNASYIQSLPPDTTVVFLGGKLSAQQLVRASAAGVLKPLQQLLEGAGSSLSLPHVLPEAGQTVASAVASAVAAVDEGNVHRLGECGGSTQASRPSAQDLQDLLPRLAANTPQVVLVCFDGMDLGAELEVVADISAAVVSARQRPVFVYAAEPSQAEHADTETARRRLQQTWQSPASQAPVTAEPLCGPKCQTQVKLLEAFILAVTVLTALGSGTLMLHALNAPTVFETPKDSSVSN